jgi:hypothetical protein
MTGILCSIAGATYAAAGRTAKTVTANGTAKISTSQSKFGGASGSIGADGTNGEHISIAAANCEDIRNWATYDGFTAETFVRHTGLTEIDDGGPSLMGVMEAVDNPYEWSFGTERNGNVRFAYFKTDNSLVSSLNTANSLIAINTWYHIAFVKNGTSLKIYIDGVEKASQTISNTPRTLARDFVMGSLYRVGARAFVDEVRISKIARYTAGFTPTTSAFTNDANTLLLLHCDGANNSTTFTDDNA